MDNIKDNAYYTNKIAKDLDFIVQHTKDITYKEFVADEVLIDSMLFRLIQVSENSSKLTETFKQEYPTIPWRAMKGLRNKIVHEYGAVDLTVIYETVIQDIPELKESLLFTL